ncbi:MAG TPA: GWxTD domain-containing protein [Terriglobales bacterium]|nr:GWxTD domain-containing protein [Terriglobales bacterium]
MRRFSKLALLTCFLVSSAFGVKLKDLPTKYRDWLQKDVVYIISKDEKDTFLQLTSDQERDGFIDRFWDVRNPTPGAPTNPYRDEIYRRIAYANQYFGHESGTEGWRSAMGRIYITLGEPKQKGMYLGYNKLRPMQIWFYSNDNPALPPFFYVVFYRPDSGGDYRIYSPYMDGPEKLVTTEPGSRTESLKVIQDQAGTEVARTALSLIPDEPVDMANARASLQSDVMLATIHDLPNHPLSKQEINRRRQLMEGVTHRVILGGEFLDALTVPLRDTDGNTVLHYVLREQKPEDFAVGQAKDSRYYYSLDISVRVSTADGHLIFAQERSAAQYFDKGTFEDISKKTFAYEGLLPLAPGKYKLEFVLSDRLKQTGFHTEKEVTIPKPASDAFSVTDLVPFSSSKVIEKGDPTLIPFGVAGVKFIPILGPQLDFVPGENLQVVYQIWAPPADPRSYEGKKLQVEYGYGRPGVRGDSKTIQEEVSREQFDANGSLVSGKKIELTDLYPGNYRLVVTVSDPGAQQKAYSSLQFRILSDRELPPTWYLADPGISDSVRNGSWDYERGMSYGASGDKKAEEHWFRQALQRNPANRDALARLVDLYFEQQAFARVAELYTRAPVNDGTEEQTLLRMAESLEKTGNLKQAVALLESAISSRKTSGPLYLMLASYYQAMGEQEKAREFERKGKSLMSSSPPVS